MSEINWIKAALRGRLGEIVGSSWRGKPYTKTYTPPGDPKTPGQTEVRSIFARVGHIASSIYKGVLEPYTYPVPRKMTKYNRMMHINKELYDDKVWDPAKLQILAGTLKPESILLYDYTASTRRLEIQWVSVIEVGTETQSSPDDVAIVVVYYEVTDKTVYKIAKRSSGLMVLDTKPLADGSIDTTKLHAYLTFAQPPGEGSHGQNSNTTHAQGEETRMEDAPQPTQPDAPETSDTPETPETSETPAPDEPA
jgi:hypothetical protein